MAIASAPARTAALGIATIAWLGLAIQFAATLGQVGSIVAALWVILRFFTIWTNLFVAVVMTGIALGQPGFGSPRQLGLLTLAILLVGIVYNLLLRGLLDLSGGAKLADHLLHEVVPLLVPLFWLFLAPKGRLTGRDAMWWAAYPLVYLIYALIRGAVDGKYPYPFLNMAKLGGLQVALNCLLIGIGFLAASYGFVVLDRQLARRVRGLPA
jgi:hypothetical protein